MPPLEPTPEALQGQDRECWIEAGFVFHDDGSITVPAGYYGPLPPLPESAYPPGAVPIYPGPVTNRRSRT